MAKKRYIKIASGWIKVGTSSNGKPYDFISLSFEGKSDKARYEVILREKATGREHNLSVLGATINANRDKQEEGANPKLPDLVVQTAIDNEE